MIKLPFNSHFSQGLFQYPIQTVCCLQMQVLRGLGLQDTYMFFWLELMLQMEAVFRCLSKGQLSSIGMLFPWQLANQIIEFDHMGLWPRPPDISMPKFFLKVLIQFGDFRFVQFSDLWTVSPFTLPVPNHPLCGSILQVTFGFQWIPAYK